MRLLYTILIYSLSLAVNAQQEVLFSQFFSQKTIANPGAAGSQGMPSLSAIHRQQWVGLEGAPVSQAFVFDAPVFANRVGLGLTIINDQIGFFNGTYINAAYSYRMVFGNGTLGVGMQGNYRYQRVGWGEAETITQRPDAVAGDDTGVPLFNVGAGVHFENNRFFAGISVPYILEKSFTERYKGIVGDFTGTAPHLFVSVGFLENSRLWTGATLRWGQSEVATAGDVLVLICQYQMSEKLNAGFAYDLSINGLQQQTTGTFELLVGYCFVKEGVGVYNPRFFK